VGGKPQKWNSRGHLFVAPAEAMRGILIDTARRQQAAQRAGVDDIEFSVLRVGLY